MATLDEAKGWNPFVLAGMAECHSPDTIAEREGEEDSSGAALLRSVLVSTLERVEYAREEETDRPWSDLPEMMDDAFHEIADGAPDVYTYTRWREFVDLAAWQEEPETGEWPEDLTDTAGVALYQIADRLARAIVAELAEQDDDQDDDQDETED